jgi:hypothetical protein
MVAGIKAVIDQLKGVYDLHYAKVTEKMDAYFALEASEYGKRPENFRGIGNISEASCELRTRSTSSPLSPAEVKMLEDNNVPVEKLITVEAIPERFYFNEKIILNNKIAEKVTKALESIPELKGMDIVFRQEPREAQYKNVVAADSFDVAAKIEDEDVLKQIYDIIGVTAIKPKLNNNDLSVILAMLKKEKVLSL